MEINMAKIMERGMLLPIGRDDQGNIRFATPEFVMGFIDSVKLPGQVMFQGKQPTHEDILNFSCSCLRDFEIFFKFGKVKHLLLPDPEIK